jgi:hypothetical protein
MKINLKKEIWIEHARPLGDKRRCASKHLLKTFSVK